MLNASQRSIKSASSNGSIKSRKSKSAKKLKLKSKSTQKLDIGVQAVEQHIARNYRDQRSDFSSSIMRKIEHEPEMT